MFVDDYVPESKKYVPEALMSGAIIINKKLLDEKGLTVEEYSTINFNKEGEIVDVEHNDNN